MTLKKDHFIIIGIIYYIFAASTFYDGSTVMQISRIVLVGFYAVILLAGSRIKLNQYSIWLFSFSLLSLVSVFYALNTSIARSGATTTIVNAVTIFAFLGLCSEVENHNIRLILTKCLSFVPLILGVYIFGKYGIFCFMNSRYIVEEHYFNSNTLGLHSAIGFLMGFWILTQKQCAKKIRWIYIAATVINLIFFILTSSRKAIFLAGLSMVFYYLFQSKTPLKFIGKVLVVAAVVFAVWLALTKIPFLYELGGNRIEQMISGFMSEYEADGSTSFRFLLIEWGLDWFRQKPILGYGVDNFRVLVGKMNTWAGLGGTYAHNNFIEIMVNLGVVGMAVYYSMYFVILNKFRLSLKHKNMMKLLYGSIFIAMIISEFGIVSYTDKYIQVVYAIVWFVMIEPHKEVNTNARKAIS